MLASVMEAALTDIGDAWADVLGKEPFSKFRIGRRDGMVKSLDQYFMEVLGIPLTLDEADLAAMKLLYRLRNKLAHSGGRTLTSSDRKRFKQWSQDVEGLRFELDFLSFSQKFVRGMFETIRDILLRLVMELKESRESRGYESN